MKNSKMAVASFLALCLILISLQGNASAASKKVANYAWGSAAIGSTSYTMVEALAATANKYVSSKNSSVSTSGSLENAVLVSQKEIQFGMVASDSLLSGYRADPPYKEKVNCSQVFAYTGWATPLLVRADSKIQKVEDLVGRRIGLGNAGQSASQMWLAIFREYGITDQVKWQYMSHTDSSNALQAGQIDGFTSGMVLGEMFDTIVTQLVRSVAVRPIEVDPDMLAKVLAKNKGLKRVVVPGKSFEAFAPNVKDQGTIGNTAILVCDPALPEDDVYEIVKALVEHAEELNAISKMFKAFTPEFAVKMMIEGYPIHPGAVRYFKEVGAM